MKLQERAEPIDPRSIDKPVGVYTIELLDDRGRVKERVVKHNYISPAYYNSVVEGQSLPDWIGMGVANNSSVYLPNNAQSSASHLGNLLAPTRLWNPYGRPSVPMDALFCTTDDTAEVDTDHWLRGIPIAFGTRWKATVAASGIRGQINEAESTITNGGQTFKTVWDFTTQQGNGTFQTLGIGSPANSLSVPRVWTGAGPRTILFNSLAPRGYLDQSIQSNLYVDGATTYWVGWEDTTTNGDVNIYSAPTADIFSAPPHATDPHLLDASGTPTLVVDTGVNWTANPGGNGAVAFPWNVGQVGVARIAGGDFVIAGTGLNAGSSTSAAGRNIAVRRVTAAGSLVYSALPAIPVSTININGAGVGLAYDGTWLYVCATGDATYASKVYRIDPADGSLSATIDIPAQYGTVAGAGMCFDGTNLLIQTTFGICRMTVGGTPVSPYCYGVPLAGEIDETAVSPWSTTSQLYGTRTRGFAGLTVDQRLVVQDANGNLQSDSGASMMTGELWGQTINSPQPTVRGMVVHDGKLWLVASIMASTAFAATGSGGLIAVTGSNCFSRTVLDTPITKTTSQNMKISYEVTWPIHDPAVNWPSHSNI